MISTIAALRCATQLLLLLLLLLLLPASSAVVAAHAASALNDSAAMVETTTVRLDFRGHSRRFDGLGSVSAGGSSRLLRDYPPRLAGEILDFMFKPRFGAGYNVLKVEIGGDGQSTHGVEPSHMHDGFASLNCSAVRGYELWLLQQAKARNPQLVTGRNR